MKKAMVTTKDNPFSPFTEFEEWYAYDQRKGYHTPSLLARLTYTSASLSEVDQDLALDRAINEIVSENVTGNYVKVFEETETETENE